MTEMEVRLKFTEEDNISLPPLGSAYAGPVVYLSERDLAAIAFSCSFAKSSLEEMRWTNHLNHYGPAIDALLAKCGIKIVKAE